MDRVRINIKRTIKRYIFAGLNANYTFDISISPAHESRQELLDLLGDVASCFG